MDRFLYAIRDERSTEEDTAFIFYQTDKLVSVQRWIPGRVIVEDLKPLKGHTNWVHAVIYDEKTHSVFTCSSDGTIRRWSMRTGKCLKIIRHESPIYCLALDSKRRTIIGGCGNGDVCVWDLRGKRLKILEGHTRLVSRMEYDPETRTLVTVSWDDTMRIWSLRGHFSGCPSDTSENKNTSFVWIWKDYVPSGEYSCRSCGVNIPKTRKIQYSGGASCLAYDAKQRLIIGSRNTDICLWSAHTGELVKTIPNCSEALIRSVTYDSHNQVVYVIGGYRGTTIGVWSLENETCLQTFEAHSDASVVRRFEFQGTTIFVGGYRISLLLPS